MPYKNKIDQKRSSRKHYEANKSKIKARARAFSDNLKLVLRAHVILEKSKPCMDCGNSFPPFVMDFDHRGTNAKVKNVADMVRACVSLHTLKYEIEKCDVVCSNCHRIRTERRRFNAGKHSAAEDS